MKSFTYGLAIGLLLPSILQAQNATPSIKAAQVTCAVSNAGGIYVYSYSVANNNASTASIAQVHLDVSQPDGGVVLDGTGLPEGLGFASTVAALNLADPAAKQFVMSTADAPTGWGVGTSINATVIWGASALTAAIAPGQSQTGFIVYSKGLPTIRPFSAEPDLDVDTIPLPEATSETLPAYVNALTQLRQQSRATGLTVGPTAPPANFVALDFLKKIGSYKEQALQPGWIDDPGVANSLDAKINAAEQALQNGDNGTARNILNALLNEVDAQAGKHLSSEAVALLKFNTLFLMSKIS